MNKDHHPTKTNQIAPLELQTNSESDAEGETSSIGDSVIMTDPGSESDPIRAFDHDREANSDLLSSPAWPGPSSETIASATDRTVQCLLVDDSSFTVTEEKRNAILAFFEARQIHAETYLSYTFEQATLVRESLPNLALIVIEGEIQADGQHLIQWIQESKDPVTNHRASHQAMLVMNLEHRYLRLAIQAGADHVFHSSHGRITFPDGSQESLYACMQRLLEQFIHQARSPLLLQFAYARRIGEGGESSENRDAHEADEIRILSENPFALFDHELCSTSTLAPSISQTSSLESSSTNSLSDDDSSEDNLLMQ